MKAAFAAAALLLAAACSDASGLAGPAGDIRVRTDASLYGLPGSGSEAIVRFTVRNTGSGPITLLSCSGGVDTEVQRREADGWVPWSTNGACPASLDPPPVVVLAPGESAAGRVFVGRDGRYRLRTYVRVAESAQFSESAFSGEFEVRSFDL
ncbi:MAG: hypothetical protein ACJ8GN_26385 [Longimicrobiaceae bacterium]